MNETLKKKAAKLLPRYPSKRACLLPLLEETQKARGWISAESIKDIAELLDVPEIEVKSTASFYTMLSRSPGGKYHLQICRNISCKMAQSEKIIEAVKNKLQIKENETTEDGLFSLTLVECLGACGNAPVVRINETYYENVSPEKVLKIIDDLKNKK